MNTNDDISLWVNAERHQSPPSGSLKRDWQRLRDALNRENAAPIRSIDARVLTPPGSSWLAAKLWLATVGLGVGLGVGFAIHGATARNGPPGTNVRAPAAPISLPTEHSTLTVHDEHTDASVAETEAGGDIAVARTSKSSNTAGRSLAPSTPTATQRSRQNPGDARSDDEFSSELELMRRVKATLDEGNARRATALIEEHRHRYPNGVFVAEREALSVLALCQSGVSEATRRAARDFLVSHPRSLHQDRVRRACGLEK